MDFQKLLLDVGKDLDKDEVKALAFLCIDILKQNLTSVESAEDLFSRLGDQNHLSAERPDLLTELLLIIQRKRLIQDLKLSDGASTSSSLVSPYRKLLYNLSAEITGVNLKEVKFLLDKSLPRRKLKGNCSTLEVFLEMEHMALISETNLNLLEKIFDSVYPMLNDKINRFKAQQVTHTGPGTQETTRHRSKSGPVNQDQVTQSLNRERSASCQRMETFTLSAKHNVDTSKIPRDLLNLLHGEDEDAALSREMSGLNAGTSLCASSEVNVDAQGHQASSETPTSQTTNTNDEALGIYPMIGEKRGVCLIINNHNFEPSPSLENRDGTFLDEESLHRVFEWLGFAVEIKRDCKSAEMLSVFQKLGSRDHGPMDCVVCCVLSHGNEGCVYGVDGSPVAIKDLQEPFNGLKCASLVDKPKLFFIQACRGTGRQQAVTVGAGGPASDDSIVADSIPSDADFLMAMATVPSFVSWRDERSGSWFIQSVCQNLLQMVPRGCDLVSILTKVNDDVSQKTAGVRKQMPQPAFSLRKKVVFPVPKAPPPRLLH